MFDATIKRDWRCCLWAGGLAFAALISGCGGGGGSSGTDNTLSPPPPPGTPGTNPSLLGSVDAVDPQSVLGWACYAGDPNNKLSVELWAIDASTGSWVYITTVAADKQRTDVGGRGVCGSGVESNYHGFELAIYPDDILVRNKSYSVYAYHRPSGQLLGAGAARSLFPRAACRPRAIGARILTIPASGRRRCGVASGPSSAPTSAAKPTTTRCGSTAPAPRGATAPRPRCNSSHPPTGASPTTRSGPTHLHRGRNPIRRPMHRPGRSATSGW